MSIRWWEKTVEYEFVLSVSREQGFFLAPLLPLSMEGMKRRGMLSFPRIIGGC
jgi:hypothetical protein